MTNSRRNALRTISLGMASAIALPLALSTEQQCTRSPVKTKPLKAAYKHSVCRWCYQSIPLEEFCEQVKPLGISSIELTTPKEWPILQRHGLTCAVATDTWVSLTRGWNEPELHDELQRKYEKLVLAAAENGIPHVIVFSGNRRQLSDEQGLENCARGLDPLVKFASQHGVTIIMELLNSKVDHHDYQCDHTPWGVALVDKIGSPQFKLLYDIYHMQIMEGDIIATIRKYKDYIAHFHTGGVPGRHELDETQELYYPAIARAIAETGFSGYIAQEFIPSKPDKIASLKHGVAMCSVE
ncbi:MAG: hydroxypyruvate isomerase [Saprospiraceae bacterium]|nr:MAG: hydroxypyruvate isomerase [Saprospiraceae bacterium]